MSDFPIYHGYALPMLLMSPILYGRLEISAVGSYLPNPSTINYCNCNNNIKNVSLSSTIKCNVQYY